VNEVDWSKVSVRELELLPRRRQDAEAFAVLQLAWAAKAAAATKTRQALVWIWLVQRARKTKSNTVLMSNEVLARYGVTRHIKMRALRQLKAAGLVTVERHPGKATVVRLLA
jgi:hypothetical protein